MALKYRNEGGLDLKACFDLLRKATRPSAPQVLRLLDAVVFNALVGNQDAHAKTQAAGLPLSISNWVFRSNVTSDSGRT